MILNGAALSDEKSFEVVAASISEPQPPLSGASSTTTKRPVFVTDLRTHSRSHGTIVARSINSTSNPDKAIASLQIFTIS